MILALRRTNYVVLAKPVSKLGTLIQPRVSCLLQGHWNYCIWIYLAPQHIEALVEIVIVLFFLDDYSRYIWVFFLSDKSNAFSIFKGFAKRAENEFDFKIKNIISDNGFEFKNSRIEDYCNDKGVKHEFLVKYTL
jgi:hypothetical protein